MGADRVARGMWKRIRKREKQTPIHPICSLTLADIQERPRQRANRMNRSLIWNFDFETTKTTLKNNFFLRTKFEQNQRRNRLQNKGGPTSVSALRTSAGELARA